MYASISVKPLSDALFMINLQKFADTPKKSDPYPYLIIEDALDLERLSALLADFPEISHPGSVPLEAVEGGPVFKELIDELNGDAFRKAVEEKFEMDLVGKPIMITLRGVMREKDGRIHTDSKSKVITVLIYFNEGWEDRAGKLRLLRNGTDIEDYVEEIPPSAGTMLVFKVTGNCWHGHKPVLGKRLSLQMNYMAGGAAKEKHEFFHRLSAKIKNLFSDKS